MFVFINTAITNYVASTWYQRLMVVSRKVKNKQHVHVSSGLCDHYSELFTRMAALKFESAEIQPL